MDTPLDVRYKNSVHLHTKVSFNFESMEKVEARREQLGLAFKKYLAGDRVIYNSTTNN